MISTDITNSKNYHILNGFILILESLYITNCYTNHQTIPSYTMKKPQIKEQSILSICSFGASCSFLGMDKA